MKLHRITAIIIRHLYLYKRSFPRLMDLLYWPALDVLLWGFISMYLGSVAGSVPNALTLFLGALILWNLLNQAQKGVSITFLEEVWARNLLNMFVTPLTVSEFLSASFLLGVIRIVIVTVVMAALSFLFYAFNLFQFGLFLIPFISLLLVFGWVLGVFTTGLILRYGSAAQVLAFGFVLLIQPFSAVFYPVSVIPESVRWIAYLVPSTYVFEGMRAVIASGIIPGSLLFGAVLSTSIFSVLSWLYFLRMFAHAKVNGALMKLD
ncbi:ABC transporter permease [Candidatus Uhrbacteria bacterium]|nr:ABC transporter permease [Candidatus Uhrbacteria bacterium]